MDPSFDLLRLMVLPETNFGKTPLVSGFHFYIRSLRAESIGSEDLGRQVSYISVHSYNEGIWMPTKSAGPQPQKAGSYEFGPPNISIYSVGPMDMTI